MFETEKKKAEEVQLWSDESVGSGAERQQERLWAGKEEVWSTGEEFKVSLFWRSRGRESRGAEESTRWRTLDNMDMSAAMEKVETSAYT